MVLRILLVFITLYLWRDNQADAFVVSPTICPPRPPSPQIGICIFECKRDNDCQAHEKCCSNGCGLTCRPACQLKLCALPCASYAVDKNGCRLCKCAPVQGTCPVSSTSPVQCLIRLPGECRIDNDCRGGQKCCRDRCQNICKPPCPSIQCDLKCVNFATDNRGCQICKCKHVTFPGPLCPPPLPTLCKGFEDKCKDDSGCKPPLRCCNTGCGKNCIPILLPPPIPVQ